MFRTTYFTILHIWHFPFTVQSFNKNSLEKQMLTIFFAEFPKEIKFLIIILLETRKNDSKIQKNSLIDLLKTNELILEQKTSLSFYLQ